MTKILIVDDSAVVRTQVRKSLEGDGYTVIEAADGAQGLLAAKNNHDIGLIVADYNMPVMNGLAMVEEIRSIEALRSVPIFMLSTETGPDVIERGKKLGVKAWIGKPFNAIKVLAAVKKLTATNSLGA